MLVSNIHSKAFQCHFVRFHMCIKYLSACICSCAKQNTIKHFAILVLVRGLGACATSYMRVIRYKYVDHLLL